ncbi:hypothetical protein [Alienimonas chondri]|nr:hypothetical protein [Alienimonas chondri]
MFDADTADTKADERPAPIVVFESVDPETALESDDSGIIVIKSSDKPRRRSGSAESTADPAGERGARESVRKRTKSSSANRSSPADKSSSAKQRRRPQASRPPTKRKSSGPNPRRDKRPPVEPSDWLTGDGLDDIDWEDDSAAPLPPPRAVVRKERERPRPKRPRQRKRPASNGDLSANVGLGIMVILTLLMVGPPLLTISNQVEAGRGPTVVEVVRWVLTALLLIGLWSGSTFVRLVWCVLMWFVALILSGVTLIALGGGDPRSPLLIISTGIYVAAVFVLTLMVYNPCFNAFMERRRGER